MDKRLALLVAFAVLVTLAVGGYVGWRWLDRTPYQEALDSVPAGALRTTFTDWAQVRELAGGDDLDAAAAPEQVDAFVTRAYDRGLTTTSALADATVPLAREFGVSPLDVDHEVYGQALDGAVVVLKLAEGADASAIEDRLEGLGYQPPADGPGSNGVWQGGPDLPPTIDPALTPVTQHVAVLVDEGLVLMSDNAGYLGDAVGVATGDGDTLTSVDGVADLAAAADEPVSSVLFVDDFACEALSMGNAGEEDQRVGDELVADAGGISPLSGMVVSIRAGGAVTVGFAFEDSDQAEDNLQPRATLAAGPAPGQGGTFPERFDVDAARADGSTVVLDLVPTDGEQQLVAELTQGPVLFATC